MQYLTDQYFTYRETPTTENGTGTLVDIKGQTIKWNQLVSSASGWASNNGTLSQSGNTYTYTVTALGDYDYQNRMQRAFPFVIPKGHKMLLSCEFYYPRNTPILIYMIRASTSGVNRSISGTTVANQWTRISGILYDTSTEFGYYQLALATIASNGYSVGDSVQVRNPMAIDLTMLFGEGNEPTTVDEFKSLFPLDYYDFNIGSLLSFNGNGLKTVGKNLVSLALSPARQQRVAGVTIQSQTNEEFTITSTGSGTYANLGLYYNLKKGTYTLKFQAEASDSFAPIITVYDGKNSQVISNSVPRNTARTFTLTEDKIVEFRCFATTTSAVRTVRFYDFQLEFGSTATAYEPYTESVINLPISTYFPTGMKQADDVYDELTPAKATARINASDMGSLPWTMPTSGVFQVYMSDAHVQPKVLTPFFKYFTNNFTYAGAPNYEDGTGGTNPSNQNIYYKDSNFTSVDALKSAMSGFYLYYELATPTETPISPELDLTFNIDKGGTEELLPSSLMNGSVDLGSLTWTYMPNNYFRSSAVISDAKIPSNENTVANIYCSMLKPNTANNVYANNEGIAIDGTGRIRIYYDDMPTDVTSFTQAMQGVYLWYEKSDSTPTTTPILCDIKYGIRVGIYTHPNPEQGGVTSGDGMYYIGDTATVTAIPNEHYAFESWVLDGEIVSTDPEYTFEVQDE